MVENLYLKTKDDLLKNVGFDCTETKPLRGQPFIIPHMNDNQTHFTR